MNGPSKPQEKKSSKLFAFLSCCSSPDVDGDDSTVPPKKTSKQTPMSNRLPTPDKAEAHTGDSSTAESRDPAYFADEKVVAVTADHPQPQEEERNAQVSPDTRGEGASAAAAASQPDVLPVSSKEHEITTVAANGVIPESNNDLANLDEHTAATESVTTTETTPKPAAGGGETQSHEEEVVQAPVVLPPPPPPPVPQPITASEGGEQQQWLLPPALPHLSNRKCLVLDLDETLVHSSFKVSNHFLRNSRVGVAD
jgi:RNA polymerase II subunit A small phosphatase-like protein